MAHTTEEWVAAVAKMRKLVGVYLGLKTLNARQQKALAIDLKTLDTDLAGLGASLSKAVVTGEATAAQNAPDSFFVASDSDEPYIIGGSPSNPKGVTWTPSSAIAWWKGVFADGLNVGKVRSTLTPGSHVLTPEGLEAARDLGRNSTIFAPEDYNPLGLEVYP